MDMVESSNLAEGRQMKRKGLSLPPTMLPKAVCLPALCQGTSRGMKPVNTEVYV